MRRHKSTSSREPFTRFHLIRKSRNHERKQKKKLSRDNTNNILIGNEDTREHQKCKSNKVRFVFYPVRTVFSTRKPRERRMNAQKRKSTTIECRKWKQIEYSKIDTNERRNSENNRSWYFFFYHVHKNITDTYRSRETFGSFCSLFWGFWTDEFAQKIPEEFEGKF